MSRLRRNTHFRTRYFMINGHPDLCSFCTIMHITCILMSILTFLCTFLNFGVHLCLSMRCHACSTLALRCIHSPALRVSNFRNHIKYMLVAYCTCCNFLLLQARYCMYGSFEAGATRRIAQVSYLLRVRRGGD